jgi:RNA polymerase sigma-70 factor (ECF subfamily)
LRGAATLLLEAYGGEILGFLIVRLRDRGAAGEAFSRFTENLWRGFGKFRWECSARVWAYAIARRAGSHHTRQARRRRAREAPLSGAGPLSEIEQKIRTATLAHARTETKSRVALLRERLAPDDQALLVLRINRGLAWPEIARVLLHDEENPDAALLDREAAKLRKRYQAAKARLRRMALDEGLISPGD